MPKMFSLKKLQKNVCTFLLIIVQTLALWALARVYKNYQNALNMLGLESLHSRREYLCLQFAKKCLKNKKWNHFFHSTKTLTKCHLGKGKNFNRLIGSIGLIGLIG